MSTELQRRVRGALERAHRLGTIGGDLDEQLAHSESFGAVLRRAWPQDLAASGTFHGVDLGTGGGIPGLMLAAVFPASLWTLVEMRSARAVEVELAVLRLGLADRVSVAVSEAQKLAHGPHREKADVVVARAFGPASMTAECASGLLRPGGTLVVSEPPATADTSDRWNPDALSALGLSTPSTSIDETFRFAVMTKVGRTPTTIPRLPARSDRGWFGVEPD